MTTDLRAAILIPAADYHEAHDWALDSQAAAIRTAGISVSARAWTDANIEDDVDVVLPLVAWGYHRRIGQWLALLDRLEAKQVPVLNPVPVLRWNSDKAYLADLGARGVATVPTVAVNRLDDDALASARISFCCDTLVVKPPVSAGADGTFRIGRNDGVPTSVAGRQMLIQPFQQSIIDHGELAVMLFNGEFSHAVVKRPRSGDFRVQPHLGGREEAVQAPASAVTLAREAVAAAPAEVAYARVDMVADDQGEWQIMELELIEPALWLDTAPGGAARFGSAIRAATEQILAKR